MCVPKQTTKNTKTGFFSVFFRKLENRVFAKKTALFCKNVKTTRLWFNRQLLMISLKNSKKPVKKGSKRGQKTLFLALF